MKVEKIEQFLKEKPGYLKVSSKKIAKRLGATVTNVKLALASVKAEKREFKLKNLKVLVYDIETSYNIVSSWRVGYNISLPPDNIINERKIICVSWKWVGEDQVFNLTWGVDHQCDKFLLEQFIEVMNQADLLVAHNGDRFDLKWIRTRAIKHGLKMLPFYQQHDTLKTAKRYFNFNSNKLDYISNFLGYEGKIKTNYELWDKVILHKNIDALKEMVEYCDEDVRQLEKVYLDLVDWDKPKTHAGVLQNRPKFTSPYSGSRNLEFIKFRSTGMGTKRAIMKDLDTGCTFEMSNKSFQDFMKYKKHDTK